MLGNHFELIGRVNWIECKCLEKSGKFMTRILLSKKEGDDYRSYNVTFFDGKENIAEKLGNEVDKGDYIFVSGKLSLNKYTKDGKEIETLQLVGFEFNKVEYDTNKKEYVIKEMQEEEPAWMK